MTNILIVSNHEYYDGVLKIIIKCDLSLAFEKMHYICNENHNMM